MSSQYQKVPPIRVRGYAAAQFFPWQRTIPFASDMMGQIFRSAIWPSSCSRHMALHLQNPAGQHFEEPPASRTGMDPELHGYPIPPGKSLECSDITPPECCRFNRTGHLLPRPLHMDKQGKAIVVPGNQVHHRGVPHRADDMVAPFAQEGKGHGLHGPAPVVIGGRCGLDILTRRHPAPAPGIPGLPDIGDSGRALQRVGCRPSRSISLASGSGNRRISLPFGRPSERLREIRDKKIFRLKKEGTYGFPLC